MKVRKRSEFGLLLLTKQGQLRMLRDRGYDISEREYMLKSDYTEKKFRNKFPRGKADLHSVHTHKHTGEVILAYFVDPTRSLDKPSSEPKINMTDTNNFLDYMDAEIKKRENGKKLTGALFISPVIPEKTYQNKIFFDNSEDAKGDFRQAPGKTVKIEIFLESWLRINPTKHIFYGKHILLTEEEKNEKLNHYNCSMNDLDVIKKTDAVSRWKGWESGMVLIERNDYSGNRLSQFTVELRVLKD